MKKNSKKKDQESLIDDRHDEVGYTNIFLFKILCYDPNFDALFGFSNFQPNLNMKNWTITVVLIQQIQKSCQSQS